MSKVEISAQLKTISASIRNSVNDRDAIATGFELIADAMEPCIDCGAAHDEAPTGSVTENNPETAA